MNPKEKAKELFDKYENFTTIWIDGEGGCYKSPKLAKKGALIAVKEILNALMFPPQLNEYRQVIHIKVLQYWKEVKQEIQAL